MKPAAPAVISPPPTRGHRVRSLPRGTRAGPERPEAAREHKPGKARVRPHQQGGRRRPRSPLGAGEGRPPGGAGGSSLLAAAASQLCATRPVPKNNVSLPGGRPGPAGGGGGGSAPRSLRRAAAQAGRRWLSRRHPSALPARALLPTPTRARPGTRGPGIGLASRAWARARGRGAGAAAQGGGPRPGWRRMRGEGWGAGSGPDMAALPSVSFSPRGRAPRSRTDVVHNHFRLPAQIPLGGHRFSAGAASAPRDRRRGRSCAGAGEAHGICSAPSRDTHCPPPCPLPNFGTPRPTPSEALAVL